MSNWKWNEISLAGNIRFTIIYKSNIYLYQKLSIFLTTPPGVEKTVYETHLHSVWKTMSWPWRLAFLVMTTHEQCDCRECQESSQRVSLKMLSVRMKPVKLIFQYWNLCRILLELNPVKVAHIDEILGKCERDPCHFTLWAFVTGDCLTNGTFCKVDHWECVNSMMCKTWNEIPPK